jgi:hypothetical protein
MAPPDSTLLSRVPGAVGVESGCRCEADGDDLAAGDQRLTAEARHGGERVLEVAGSWWCRRWRHAPMLGPGGGVRIRGAP